MIYSKCAKNSIDNIASQGAGCGPLSSGCASASLISPVSMAWDTKIWDLWPVKAVATKRKRKR